MSIMSLIMFPFDSCDDVPVLVWDYIDSWFDYETKDRNRGYNS